MKIYMYKYIYTGIYFYLYFIPPPLKHSPINPQHTKYVHMHFNWSTNSSMTDWNKQSTIEAYIYITGTKNNHDE